MYVATRDELYLVPTAEGPVTNIHAGEILVGALEAARGRIDHRAEHAGREPDPGGDQAGAAQALERMEKEIPFSPEIQRVVDFIKRSQRGISK